jgi:NAD(P)-dependent dehydrogenase (short-subunit alcohol dehydrogenase family)
LVNNASLLRFGRLEAAAEAEFRDMIEANLIGTFNCSKYAIRRMYPCGRGSIVNVTSGAQVGMQELGCYGATKGAVASFTYAWAAEAAGSGVRVNAVSPWGSTRMMAETPQMIPPEANVPVVAFLLSDLSKDVNGQVVRITGSKLSLMTHPAIREPVLERNTWTVEAVSEAFHETLAALQLPVGLSILDIQSIGS